MSPQLCPRPHTKAELGGGWRQWWYVTSVMSFYKTMASVFSVLGCSLSLITCFEESQMPCAESPWETYGETGAAKNRGFWPSLEKEMATHSSIPAWRIPWTEEPGELQSVGSQRVRHDWVRNVNASPNTDLQPHCDGDAGASPSHHTRHLTSVPAHSLAETSWQTLSQSHPAKTFMDSWHSETPWCNTCFLSYLILE